MKEMYYVDGLHLEIPIELKVKNYMKWKSFNCNDDLPKDCVYAGNTYYDSPTYVVIVENSPGKVI